MGYFLLVSKMESKIRYIYLTLVFFVIALIFLVRVSSAQGDVIERPKIYLWQGTDAWPINITGAEKYGYFTVEAGKSITISQLSVINDEKSNKKAYNVKAFLSTHEADVEIIDGETAELEDPVGCGEPCGYSKKKYRVGHYPDDEVFEIYISPDYSKESASFKVRFKYYDESGNFYDDTSSVLVLKVVNRFLDPRVNGAIINTRNETGNRFCGEKGMDFVNFETVQYRDLPNEPGRIYNRQYNDWWVLDTTSGYNYGKWEVHTCDYDNWKWDNCYNKVTGIICKSRLKLSIENPQKNGYLLNDNTKTGEQFCKEMGMIFDKFKTVNHPGYWGRYDGKTSGYNNNKWEVNSCSAYSWTWDNCYNKVTTIICK